MSVNISEEIPTATETMTQKLSIHLLGMSIYSKFHNTHLLHLFVDMCILKVFFLKHDFASLRNFKKWGQNLCF